jgi:hypothetical protein
MACPVHCHLFRSPWGSQSPQSNALQVDADYPAQCIHPGCNQFVPISKLSKSRTCHAQLGLSDNQILSLPHPIGTVWQSNNVHSQVGIDTSIEPLCTLNTCGIRWSPESAQAVHPLVAPQILRIPATNKIISIAILTTLFVCHRMGHIRIRSLAISFRCLV